MYALTSHVCLEVSGFNSVKRKPRQDGVKEQVPLG